MKTGKGAGGHGGLPMGGRYHSNTEYTTPLDNK